MGECLLSEIGGMEWGLRLEDRGMRLVGREMDQESEIRFLCTHADIQKLKTSYTSTSAQSQSYSGRPHNRHLSFHAISFLEEEIEEVKCRRRESNTKTYKITVSSLLYSTPLCHTYNEEILFTITNGEDACFILHMIMRSLSLMLGTETE